MAPMSMACVPSQTTWLLMRCNFVEQDAHPLRRLGDLEAEQLLDGERVDEIVDQVREVIDAVGQRVTAPAGRASHLELLLDAGVQEADVGPRLDDGLAVEFEYHAQHAVRGRVLRPHVQGHAARTGAALFGLDVGGRRIRGEALIVAHALHPVSR